MNDVKRQRQINFAIGLLMQLDMNVAIRKCNYDIFDFNIETVGDKSKAYYIVIGKEDFNDSYVEGIKTNIRTNSRYEEFDIYPMYFAILDESKFKLSIKSISLPHSFDTFHYQDEDIDVVNKESFKRHIDSVRRLNRIVSLLNVDNVYVEKSFILEEDSYQRKCNAKLVYLRKMGDDYKMHPKQVKTDKEKFDRLLNGHTQDEYPSDELDDLILEALKTQYPNIEKPKNELICTSTAMRDVLNYQKLPHETVEFRFLPDISKIPQNIIPLLGTIEGVKFSMDIYMPARIPLNAYANVGFELKFDFNTWAPKLQYICEKLTTYKTVKEFIDESY